jgi:hypothetical protein
VKLGTDHVISVIYPHHIRIGVIGIQNGIDVGSVSLIAPGSDCGLRRGDGDKNNEDEIK